MIFQNNFGTFENLQNKEDHHHKKLLLLFDKHKGEQCFFIPLAEPLTNNRKVEQKHIEERVEQV